MLFVLSNRTSKLLSSNELHLRFISVICAPRAHENQKWGARAPLCPMVSAPMPLPLTVSCFDIEIQIGFTFLVPAYPGSPGQTAVKRVYLSWFRFSVGLIFNEEKINIPHTTVQFKFHNTRGLPICAHPVHLMPHTDDTNDITNAVTIISFPALH